MNEDEILNSLIFCNICYFPENNKKRASLLISYCMHIICSDCIKETDYCIICNTKTSFIPVNESISVKLKKNPSKLFSRPVDICMFQINSSINLIEYLREEINTYKKLLKLARIEIEKLKTKPTNKKRENTRSENNKPKYNNNQKISKVCEIIKNSKRKSDKSTSVLDFSNSSCTTGRLTIPKDFNPYKKFYRK